MRRKGELSYSGINRGWPWQVPINGDEVSRCHKAISAAAAAHGACLRQQAIVIRSAWHVVYCFAEADKAEAFAAAHGAEVRHASTREKGLPWSVWRRSDV